MKRGFSLGPGVLVLLIGLHVWFAAAISAEPGADRRPNIVLILSDDMGFSDLGCYGGEIQTPHLDTLAANGLRFTQFYNTARCCPTRAALLTGLYPHQAGVGHMLVETGQPAYSGGLNNRCRTIAEALRPAGYRSYISGKWHMTRHLNQNGPKENWPLQRGFDRFYGIVSGGGSFYDPYTLARDNQRISPYADSEYQPEHYYFTDAITDQAIRFVQDHRQDHAHAPFFLYVAYTAAHWPMHALPEDIAKYRGRYDVGYEAIRQARWQKAVELGLIAPEQPMSPSALVWEQVSNKELEAKYMEVYAAMVDRMDQGIGRLVAELQQQGLLENTLLFFLQDNGGCAEGMGRGVNKNRVNGPRPATPTLKPMAAEMLCPALVPTQTRSGFPVRQGPLVEPGPEDTYVAYGKGWANVSNTPFREYKHWVHEGGVATPLIVHWPAGIKEKGELRRTPGHLIDIMPTCLAVAGADYQAARRIPAVADAKDDNQILPLPGKSLLPVFANSKLDREALYWEHEGNWAIRVGDWKLVSKFNQSPELYRLDKDRAELENLAVSEPERVQTLKAQWQTWADHVGVVAWPTVDPGRLKERGK